MGRGGVGQHGQQQQNAKPDMRKICVTTHSIHSSTLFIVRAENR